MINISTILSQDCYNDLAKSHLRELNRLSDKSHNSSSDQLRPIEEIDNDDSFCKFESKEHDDLSITDCDQRVI